MAVSLDRIDAMSQNHRMKWHHDALAFGTHWPNLATYQRACDDAYKRLELVSGNAAFTPEVPTVVCVTRNEHRRILRFVEHYKKLGAESIHVIDNGSEDKTAEIASSFAGVTLWSTKDSYARGAFGQLWVGAVVRRRGLGRWVLNVDADEMLVYGNMEAANLGDVQHYLSNNGIERLYTPLVDIYPRDMRSDSAGFANKSDLYFDGKPGGDTYRTDETIFGPSLSGGPRGRMMAAIGKTGSPWLSKFALAKWDGATAYANVHFPYPFDRNPSEAYAALIHLKLFGDLAQRADLAIEQAEHLDSAAEYKLYREWLSTGGADTLLSPDHSAPYNGPQSLIDARIIDTPPWRSSN